MATPLKSYSKHNRLTGRPSRLILSYLLTKIFSLNPANLISHKVPINLSRHRFSMQRMTQKKKGVRFSKLLIILRKMSFNRKGWREKLWEPGHLKIQKSMMDSYAIYLRTKMLRRRTFRRVSLRASSKFFKAATRTVWKSPCSFEAFSSRISMIFSRRCLLSVVQKQW